MAFEFGQLLASTVPNLGGAVLAKGRQLAAIGAKHDAVDTFEFGQLLASAVPNSDDVVYAIGRQLAAIGAKHDAVDIPLMPFQPIAFLPGISRLLQLS